MVTNISVTYIQENFEPTDRLAIVCLNKKTGSVVQRLGTAEKIAAPDFQAWLRHKNAERHEIYVSMNTLTENATGRTKSDVAAIRHVYLDFDHNGTRAVQNLRQRDDLPPPNYLVNSSPDKWQVIWKVAGFAKEQAEALQKALARETGADPAATDCARVLRLPGFYNHKYARRHFVRMESLAQETYSQERFPKFPSEERGQRALAETNQAMGARVSPATLSQSERDWAYARRALARGESEAMVIAAIASHRRYDKHNPHHYAELTVRKASETLSSERQESSTNRSPER